MSYNGSGTFQINTSGQPVVTGTSISSTVFNALTADLATGLSTAITKDGQTTTTARIPFALGINSTLVTDATNTTSGSIITAGGVGIAKALYVGTTANVAGAVTLGGVATFSAQPIFSSLTASSAVATDASKGLVSVTNTGTGNNVLATTPTIATPSISSPTISDGTANGVAYLNGSKVLTTGSALVFDGTNLGVGVTPSAWSGGAGAKAIQMGGTSFSFLAANKTQYIYGNAYYDGSNNRYINSDYACSYGVNTSGAFQWNIAPSGTAGNTITFTQAMTLDASGNLRVGTTSSLSVADKLTVVGGNFAVQRSSGITTFMGDNTTDGYAGTATNHAFALLTNSVERARIDTSGNLLVGATSTLGSTAGILVANGGANVQAITTNSTSSSAYYIGRFYSGGTEKGYIYFDGTNVSYTNLSDYRLKENVQPMQNALDKVAQLNPVTYNWKSNGKAGQGFIAHELQAVVPDCVTGDKDAVDEDGNPKYQGIDTSFLVATLTAAIQEQQALIQTLTARITALEST